MRNKMKVHGTVNKAGVYAMFITKDNGEKEYLYVGSAIEVNDALSRHIYYLKRGKYAFNNKAILQKYYDLEMLEFEIIKESEMNYKLSEMSSREKETVQKSLSILEKMYIDLFKDTICNKHMKVTKRSSNRNSTTVLKRRKVNLGTKNPNSKYSQDLVEEILWFKENTSLSNYKIAGLVNEQLGYNMHKNYVYNLGLTKWITVSPKNHGILKVEVA
ncbi:hypothetical protein [Clostridium chrysemydis]|uniref:hypothetical protein n=1 Tax=Clostridium chrysemydis TaxID=2665504 RepID=UPI001883E78C|nr:hypothetical protein [Clostridium chrysemydis]